MNDMESKVGVFAGGAAHGAYTVGLHSKLEKQYDIYIGTSTGALIALYLACARLDPRFYDWLVYEYSNTDNKEMYGSKPPFKNGKLSMTRLFFSFFRMHRKNRNYMYDISTPLRAKIIKYFKPAHFIALRQKGINVIVTSKNVDVKKSPTTYTSILRDDMTYDRFVDWVVASASIPFFAKPTTINGYQYVDGGVLDPVPTALLKNYKDIDIWLSHSKQAEQQINAKANSWGKLAMNLFNDIRYEIKMDDLKDIKANVYHSRVLDWDSADFDTKKMREAIRLGQQDGYKQT